MKKISITSNRVKWENPVGHTMHELLHVLGFHHEHSRPDRNRWLTVKETGINYDRLETSEVESFGSYDVKSIMHYPLNGRIKLRNGWINLKLGRKVKDIGLYMTPFNLFHTAIVTNIFPQLRSTCKVK